MRSRLIYPQEKVETNLLRGKKVINMQNNRRVFFYPLSFSPRLHPNCRFSITLKSFRRDIYRPITGKERLFGQTPLDPPRHLKLDIPAEFIASDIERCRRQVSRFVKDVEPRIRDTLVLYAIQLYGESRGKAFELKADAKDVELHLMEESKGWTTTCISKSIDPVHECIICLEEVCDDEAIVLHDCCHVFHKVCLFSWIWSKSSCPICRHPIYRRPKF